MFPVDADAPLWIRTAAQILLVIHVGGGVIGLVSGTVALLTRKGGKLHRGMGNIFFFSMLGLAGIGAVVALLTGDRINSLAGFMTLYFLATGWATARKRNEGVGGFEIAALFVALAVASSAPMLAMTASQAPDGGWTPFYIFSSIIALAALCDLKIILRRGITCAQRVARHVWRMCFALFVATLSFFLGQAEIFPAAVRAFPVVLVVLALAPLGFLIFWMLRVRLSRKWRGLPQTSPPNLTPMRQDARSCTLRS
jgi:uncharacterized membrane protein